MNDAFIAQLVAEWNAARTRGGDEALEAVCTAIFLEDVFDLTLTDEQLQPAFLTEASALQTALQLQGRD